MLNSISNGQGPEAIDLRDRKIVFVCGLHRSGTTLLFRWLRQSSAVSGFHDTGVPKDEGQLLQTVFTSDQAHGGAGIFGFRRHAQLREDSSLITEENRRRLYVEWARYWDLDKPCLLEKSPPNVIRTRFLQAMFPNSYFIFLTRHPAATAMATYKWKWRRATVGKMARHWVHCYDLAIQDMSGLRNYIWVKYEDIIARPEDIQDQLFGFLDLPPEPIPTGLRTDINERYFEAFERKCNGPLCRLPMRILKNDLEPRARKFGYSFTDLRDIMTFQFQEKSITLGVQS